MNLSQILKANPYHDERGRFSSLSNATAQSKARAKSKELSSAFDRGMDILRFASDKLRSELRSNVDAQGYPVRGKKGENMEDHNMMNSGTGFGMVFAQSGVSIVKRSMPKKTQAHPGFEKVAERIAAQQGVSMERARAILAAGSRGASAAAKKKNPRLNKVKGKAKKSFEEILKGE